MASSTPRLVRGNAMGMDRLNTAATAAGYAMATPEDDTEALVAPAIERPEPGRALMVVPAAQPISAMQNVSAAVTWLRGHLPTFGGRAPA